MSINGAFGVSISSSDGGEAATTSAIVAETVTGSHVLRIKGYSNTKGLGIGKCIKTSAFSIGGHHWFISYYLKSMLWTSELDSNSMFLTAVVSACRHSAGNPTRIKPSPQKYRGFTRFVKRKDLEESSCLKDDCLKIKCTVVVSKGIRTEPTTQFVAVPPSDMHRHFGSLLSGAVGADVTLEVAGEVFAAHRNVLAARSPVFMAELFGAMKESTMDSIRIQDMEARVFRAMLHFIYTDTMPNIDKEEDVFGITQHLLVAADRYDLERLRLICEEKLCLCIDTGNVLTTFALAERHGCHGLKNACLDFLRSPRHLKMVMAAVGFDHIMTSFPSLLKELLDKVATCP